MAQFGGVTLLLNRQWNVGFSFLDYFGATSPWFFISSWARTQELGIIILILSLALKTDGFLPNNIFCTSFVVDISGLMLFFLQEFNVKAHPVNKPHFVGRFLQGLPSLSRKKSGDPKWNMQREGLQGRQLTDALRVF
jgi:hypothetical protein